MFFLAASAEMLDEVGKRESGKKSRECAFGSGESGSQSDAWNLDSAVTGIAHSCTKLRALLLHDCGAPTELSDHGLDGLTSAPCARTLTTLDLSFCEGVSDAGLLNVARRCPGLTELTLACLKVTSAHDVSTAGGLTSAGIAHVLAQCTKLTSCAELNNRSLKAIARAGVALKVLRISGCDRVTDKGLRSLGKLRGGQLEELVIQRAGLGNLRKKAFLKGAPWPKLHTLAISECDYVGNGTMNSIALHCSALTSLEAGAGFCMSGVALSDVLDGCEKLEKLMLFRNDFLIRLDSGLPCPTLRQLDISDCPLRAEDFRTLAVRCPNLENVDVSGNEHLDGEGLMALAQGCKRLALLDVRILGSARLAYDVLASLRFGAFAGSAVAAEAQAETQAAARADHRRSMNRVYQQESRKRKAEELEIGQPDESAEPLCERRKRAIVRKNALAVAQSLRGRTNEDQAEILNGTFGHAVLESARGMAGMPSKKKMAVRTLVFEQTARALQSLTSRGTHSADETAARHAILAASTGSPVTRQRLQRAYSKVLRQPRTKVATAISRRGQLDRGGGFWALTKRARRKDGISEAIKELVIAYWARKTRVSPNRKDVVRHRTAPNRYDTHPAHLLEISQAELYQKFQEDHPEVKIGERSFEVLKPWFVRKLKDRNVCCCKYDVEMRYLLDALRRVRMTRHEQCKCGCNLCRPSPADMSCQIHKKDYNSVSAFCEELMCPKPEGSDKHKPECISGKCGLCGFERKFATCPVELDASAPLVKYKSFQYVVVLDKNGQPIKDRDGRDKKRIKEVMVESSPSELFSALGAKVPPFLQHTFRVKWQDKQFRELLDTFPVGTVVSVIDFAENYSFEQQDEIQSMHWHSDQITILVHITYRHKQLEIDGVESTAENRQIARETVFYISDDKQHDTHFVQHCLVKKHAAEMKERGIKVEEHRVFSDGAASQFKSRRAFYFVARYPGLTAVKMEWYFFESGHGKGEHDGAGAVVKSALRKWQLVRDGESQMTSAAEAVRLLTERLSSAAPTSFASRAALREGVSRKFVFIGEDEVDRSVPYECKQIPGTRSFHAVRGAGGRNATTLFHRQLACFCGPCFEGKFEDCESTAYAGDWVQVELQPSQLPLPDDLDDDDDDAPRFGGDDHNELPNLLEPGDFFAMAAESENEPYFLGQCTRGSPPTS
ncbi:hypothetical protein KFL_005820050 [Klebsormidium nitens]|uniref:Uncharacterized protein n=1 Tax=Klebsormidium nitens TaxID=105231 RepID=A0A1Y1ILE9_KLENI|nr:hypothetical protein KFL_005820050 [Klebsormidium nitens]|eukprot:GAQ89961.1 hypothetical protein KFL_005820050 [Klebsormidium nitens]